MIAVGVELRRGLACFDRERLGMLGFFAHDIAEGEDLYVGGEQVSEQAGASAAGADDADSRCGGERCEGPADHGGGERLCWLGVKLRNADANSGAAGNAKEISAR